MYKQTGTAKTYLLLITKPVHRVTLQRPWPTWQQCSGRTP